MSSYSDYCSFYSCCVVVVVVLVIVVVVVALAAVVVVIVVAVAARDACACYALNPIPKPESFNAER